MSTQTQEPETQDQYKILFPFIYRPMLNQYIYNKDGIITHVIQYRFNKDGKIEPLNPFDIFL